jgi:hypothetical protein
MSALIHRIYAEPEHVRLLKQRNRVLVVLFALIAALPVVALWGRLG